MESRHEFLETNQNSYGQLTLEKEYKKQQIDSGPRIQCFHEAIMCCHCLDYLLQTGYTNEIKYHPI